MNKFTPFLKTSCLFLMGLLMVGFAGTASAKTEPVIDAQALLQKMHQAAESLDYSGDFISVKDGNIGSMKISHLASESGGMQIISSLNGSMREIIQTDEMVACVLPDQKMGVREKQQKKKAFNFALAEDINALKTHYELSHMGASRVANRSCNQISVMPKDHFRYGYELCIDDETYLLLRSVMLDYEGNVLESFMFVDVQFDDIDLDDFESATPSSTLAWKDEKPMMSAEGTLSTIQWEVEQNSPGFVLAHAIERMSPLVESKVTHLVLSDGLANVSVFITKQDPLKPQALPSQQMGSLNTFSREADGYRITVIGEVPPQTVKLIALKTKRI